MTTCAMSRTSRITLALLQSLLLLTPGVRATSYGLTENYFGGTFFDAFDFFTGADPTHGFVTYIDRTEATNLQLAYSRTDGSVYMGVDSSSVLTVGGAGRKSIRIESKKTWTHGLFIADITHMPGGICGTWPAFWMFGPNWPNSGEIDIIEGVNSQKKNLVSLHTSPGCTVAGNDQLGTLQSSNCDATINYNTGCGSSATTPGTYGTEFNAASGGVHATEWTSDYIRVWFFQRGNIPLDIKSGRPDPSTWGTPEANFEGDCDIDTKFMDHKLVFDTTFCGDWGNAVWASDPTCSSYAPTCDQYVASNPQAFTQASWSINYVRVFQSQAAGDPVPVVEDLKIASGTIVESALETLPNFTDGSFSIADFPQATTGTGGFSIADFPPASTGTGGFSIADFPPLTTTATADESYTAFDVNPTATTGPPEGVSTSASGGGPSPPHSTPPSHPVHPGHPGNGNNLFRFVYTGCVAFSEFSVPPIRTFEDHQMTIDKCLRFCQSFAHAFVSGNTCDCAIVLPGYKLYSDRDCNLRCSGKSDEFCGGNLPQSPGIKPRDVGVQARWDTNYGDIWDGHLFSLYSKRFDIGDEIHDAIDDSLSGLLQGHHSTTEPLLNGLLDGLFDHKHGLLGHKLKHKHPHSRSRYHLSKDDTSGYGMGGDGRSEGLYTKVITTTIVDMCSCAEKTLTTRTITTTLTCSPSASPPPLPAIQDHRVPKPYKPDTYPPSDCPCDLPGWEAARTVPTWTIPTTRTVTRTVSKVAGAAAAADISAEEEEYRSAPIYPHISPPWTTGPGAHRYPSPAPSPAPASSTPTPPPPPLSPSSSSSSQGGSSGSGPELQQVNRAESMTTGFAWGWGVEGAVCCAVLTGLIVFL